LKKGLAPIWERVHSVCMEPTKTIQIPKRLLTDKELRSFGRQVRKILTNAGLSRRVHYRFDNVNIVELYAEMETDAKFVAWFKL
jgi:hypothetical protein